MKPWQRVILLSAVLMGTASCDKMPKYVITAKSDNKIIYRQAYGDDTEYVICFRPNKKKDAELYQYLVPGDTIQGFGLGQDMGHKKQYEKDYKIMMLNGRVLQSEIASRVYNDKFRTKER